MNQHREIFNQLLETFGYTAKQVSSWAGINESRLSRFRTGKLDLEAGEFFLLLECLPKEFQKHFWTRFGLVNGGWQALIATTNQEDVAEILRHLADHWAVIQGKSRAVDRDHKEPAALAL